ncbi:MAG: carboxypeptidase regulatory-like domain-containing protein, partial [Blastocatellia bacterium]
LRLSVCLLVCGIALPCRAIAANPSTYSIEHLHRFFPDDLDHLRIEGVVTDANAQALPGVSVTLIHEASGKERAVISDAAGKYRFAALAPGRYTLGARMSGFRTARMVFDGRAGVTLRQNIQLELAAIAAEITVEASQELQIDTTRTVNGGALTRRDIDSLPNDSRNIFDLVTLFAGTSAPALSENSLAEGDTQDRFRTAPEETGIFSLSGGTPFSNNLTIEGLDNNDDRAARERFIPTTDAVEEFQVISHQFSAEYGRASGGRVNVRLRGGANQFHGRGFQYFRDEALNANTVTRNSDPARGFRLPYRQNNPGVSLGGPILRNRAFFFTSYEYDNIYDRADIAALVPLVSNTAFPLPAPTGANLGASARDRDGKAVIVNGGQAVGLYDQQLATPRRAHTLQNRSDLHFGGQHTAFVLLTLARNRDERAFPGGRRLPDTLRQTGRDSLSLALADNFTISPGLVNIARAQFSRLTPADAPYGNGPVVLIDIDDPRDVIGNANANPLTRAGNLTAGSSNISGTDRRETRWQLQETLAITRQGHTLRLGADVQMIRSQFNDLADVTGTFRFASVPDYLAGKFSRFVQRFNTASGMRNTYTGLFAQHDWKPARRLNVSLGLRWDNETILRDRNNFGPRVSVAWDPLGTAKTVIRGGYGMFVNRVLLRTLDDFVLTSNKILVDTDILEAARLLGELRFPQALAANDPRVAQTGVREAGFVRRVSPDLRTPESYQASLGFERELTRGFKVEVSYVFNRGLHLWRESNANAPRLPAGMRDWAEFLTARDFNNTIDPLTRLRPITSTGNADIVRFNLSVTPTETRRENGRTVVLFGLNNPSTSNATSGIRAAQAAIRQFRPDPNLTQVELLEARGNSAYHGLSVELKRSLGKRGTINGVYTFSRLLDDGVLNTSSPLVPGDFRREWSRSLMDARHRVALYGSYQLPRWLGAPALAGTFSFNSSRPFNLGANGNDRNLDDVNNDRPNFSGEAEVITWRRPGERLDVSLFNAFALPVIGTSGNLGRNAGHGPGQWALSMRVSRQFGLGERKQVTPLVEVFNPANSTVYAFGAEFVDYNPASSGAFLSPRRTLRPRTIRLGVKFDF